MAQELRPLLVNLRHAASFVCRLNIPDAGAGRAGISPAPSAFPEHACSTFPLPSDWQTESHRSLSLRTLHLCLGCAVSAYSGWDERPFNVQRLLRSRWEGTMQSVALSMEGERASGYIGEKVLDEVAAQWSMLLPPPETRNEDIVGSALPPRTALLPPALVPLDLGCALEEMKRRPWYGAAVERERSSNAGVEPSGAVGARFGEDHGLDVLLALSRVCLRLAECDITQRDELLKISFSILFPVTRFCYDQEVWTSDIGANKSLNVNVHEWRSFVGFRPYFSTEGSRKDRVQTSHQHRSRSPPPETKTKPRRQQEQPKKAVPKPSQSLGRIVNVPMSVLLREWLSEEGTGAAVDKMHCSDDAKLAMKTLDDNMRYLRSCRTPAALQRAFLNVSAALIDVASKRECHNPFLCLQQAAIFAAQGPRGGSSDEPFRKLLPEDESCGPLDLILILGRADCLRAVNFIDEAMFLCSFVAGVCSRCREGSLGETIWGPRWRVVSIYLYLVSVSINSTLTTEQESGTEPNVGNWERFAKDEFKKGRYDAVSVIRGMAVRPPGGLVTNTCTVRRDESKHPEDRILHDRASGKVGVDDSSVSEKDNNCSSPVPIDAHASFDEIEAFPV